MGTDLENVLGDICDLISHLKYYKDCFPDDDKMDSLLIKLVETFEEFHKGN